MKLFTWYNYQTDSTKAVSIFSTTVICALILFFLLSSQMGCLGENAMEPYKRSQVLINRYIDSLEKPANLQEKYFNVFKMQHNILSTRKKHYLHLGIIFFSNYYGVLILLILFSCVGGVVLFLVANQGWANANITLKALFLALALIIAFCGFFPTVFKQQENFDENLKSYMSYTKAEVNIINQLCKLNSPYFASSLDTSQQSPVWVVDSSVYYHKLDSMISLNETVINNLTNYVLNINAKEVKSMADMYRMINSQLVSSADSIKYLP